MYKNITIYLAISFYIFSAQLAFSELKQELPSCHAQIDILHGNLSEPTVDKNTAFISFYSKKNECYILYGVNSENGKPRFKHCMKSMNYCYDERTLYIAEKDGKCLAINHNGEIKWREKNLNKPIFYNPIIKDSIVYVTLMDNSIVALNSQNGDNIYKNEIKNINFKGNITSPPTIHDKYIYVTTSEGIIYRIIDGKIKDKIENMGYIRESPLFANGSTFVANANNVFEIDQSFKDKKTYNIDLGSIDKIFINSEYLIVAGENQIECFKIGERQKPLWEKRIDYQSIALDSQNIYIGESNIISLNIQTGEQYWDYNIKTKSHIEDEIRKKIAEQGYILPENEAEIEAKYQKIEGQNIVSLNVIGDADNKTIIAGTNKGKYYAIDGNGKLKWNFEIDDLLNPKLLSSESAIYVSTNNGFYQLDDLSLNLKKCLDLKMAKGNFQSVADIVNDFLYIISDFGTIYKYSLKTKEKLWEALIFDTEGLYPILSEDRNTIFISAKSGYIYAINTKDGSSLEPKRVDGIINCSPTIYKNWLYIGSDSGKLSAVDTKTNNIFSVIDANDSITFISASPSNILCVGTKSGKLLILEINADGKASEKWSKAFNITSMPYLDENKIYFGTDDGKMHAILLNSGNDMPWQQQANEKIKGNISISSGIIYFASDDGYLYAIDANDGSLIWKYSIYGQPISKLQVSENRIYILSSVGTLYVLEKPMLIDYAPDKFAISDYDKEQQIVALDLALKSKENSLITWQKLISSYNQNPDFEIKSRIWQFLESDWMELGKIGFQIKTNEGIFSFYINDDEVKKSMIDDIKLIYLLQFMLGRDYVSPQERDNFVKKNKNFESKTIKQDIEKIFIYSNEIWGTKKVTIDELKKEIPYKKSKDNTELESLIINAIEEIKLGNKSKAQEILAYNKIDRYMELRKKDPQILLMILRSAWILKAYIDDDYLSKNEELWKEAFENKRLFLNNSELCFYYADILERSGDIEKANKYYQYSIELGKNELSCYKIGNIYLGEYLKSPLSTDNLEKAKGLFEKAEKIHSSRSEKSTDLYEIIMIHRWSNENISGNIKTRQLVAKAFLNGYNEVDESYFAGKTVKQLVNDSFKGQNEVDWKIALNLLAIYAHKHSEATEKISDLEDYLSEYQEKLIDTKLLKYYLLLIKVTSGNLIDEIEELDPLISDRILYFPDFYTELRYLYAKALGAKKDWSKAIVKYEDFIEKSKDSQYFKKDEYSYHIGYAYYMSVYPDEIDEFTLFKQGQINDPLKIDRLKSAIYWLSKSNKYQDKKEKMLLDAYYSSGKWQEASEMLIKMKKENYLLAQCYINLGKYEDAKEVAKKLEEKSPEDLIANYMLTLSIKTLDTARFQQRKDELEKKINNMTEGKEKEALLMLFNHNIK